MYTANFGRNPEPIRTHFLGSDLVPGTRFDPICLEPGTHQTHIFEMRVASTRNPRTQGDPCLLQYNLCDASP